MKGDYVEAEQWDMTNKKKKERAVRRRRMVLDIYCRQVGKSIPTNQKCTGTEKRDQRFPHALCCRESDKIEGNPIRLNSVVSSRPALGPAQSKLKPPLPQGPKPMR